MESDGPGALDLREMLAREALDGGIEPGQISSSGLCTATHAELFHSHRASDGRAGRMAAFIGLR